MRIIEVIKDFLKVFIMIKGKRNPNYHLRVKKFSQNINQIAEKNIISKILKKQNVNRILDFDLSKIFLVSLYLSFGKRERSSIPSV